MSVKGAQDRITATVSSWPGVTVEPHRFGGVEFRLGRRELGHIHGASLVDIPFPKTVRDELVADGRVEPHHLLPESGWISFHLKQPEDVDAAIGLLRRSYDLAQGQRARHAPGNAKS